MVRISGACAVMLVAACVDPAPPVECRGPCGDGPLFALTTLTPATPTEAGTVEGFDLDGHLGAVRADCDGEDFADAAGRTGIDNQIAEFVPVLEGFIGEAPRLLLQNAINEGGMTVLVELVGPGATGGDGPVHLAFHRGEGKPLLGTDKRMLAGQTFDIADAPLLAVCPDAKVDATGIRCGPFEYQIHIVVFGKTYDLVLHEARFRLDYAAEGDAKVVLGGSVNVDELDLFVSKIENVGGLYELVHAALPPFADLIDGATSECTGMSAAFTGTVRPAFAVAPLPEAR